MKPLIAIGLFAVVITIISAIAYTKAHAPAFRHVSGDIVLDARTGQMYRVPIAEHGPEGVGR